jgi:hypothetical protein
VRKRETERHDESRRSRINILDIGVFDENHSMSFGREILKNGLLNASREEVTSVINNLKGNHLAKFTIIPSIKHLTHDHLMKLRLIADNKYEKAIKNE